VSPRTGSHILVVDDQPVIASSLAAILRMNGFSARFFAGPLEALAAARSESPGARTQGHDFRLLQKPVFPSEFLSEIGQLPA
jgi:CheY-like chemotaxis protein